MITGVMDSNSVDSLKEPGRFEQWSGAVESGQLRLLWTHVTIDELCEIGDVDQRAHLITLGAAVCHLVATGAAVFDFSRYNFCRFGDDEEAFEELRAGNIKNTRDALICSTAAFEKCPLITRDTRMTKRALRRGIDVWTPDVVDQRLRAVTADSASGT